jgi:hypothetical protein
MSDRMAYSGTCSNPDCSAMFVVAPHPETPDDVAEQIAKGPSGWENFTYCWVCDSSIDWNGNDPLPFVIRD